MIRFPGKAPAPSQGVPSAWRPARASPVGVNPVLALAGNVPFLMKDVVLLAVSVYYLLKQDVMRLYGSSTLG